jgi:hypothetical protein
VKLTTTTDVDQDRPAAFLEEAECLLITGQGRNLEASEVETIDTVIAINLQDVVK